MNVSWTRVLALALTFCLSRLIVVGATDNVLSSDADYDDKALAKNMRLVSMSFDPDYDTPQRLATYSEAIRDEKSGCEWRFATAKSRAELDSILNGYGQVVDKRADPADPQGPMYHILRIFLIDRQGRIRNIYSSATLDPRLVFADVKTLL